MCFILKLIKSVEGHMLGPVLEPFLDQALGAVFYQNGPRWAQEGHQELQRAFSKTLKNLEFLHVFGSRGLPREPQETQEPPKKHPKSSKGPCKKLPKKIPKNAIVVKNALSWRSHFERCLGTRFGDFFCLFLSSLLVSFLITVWTFSKPILEAMVDENRPKREANDSKQPSKASKTPKAAFSKKHLKKQWVFHYFWQQRPLKNVSRGPRCPQ